MKVATFNVNSLRARLTIVVDWLRRKQPDVLCIQETKVQDVDFPTSAFDEIGYSYAFRGQKSYNGVAVLSKSVIGRVEFGFGDEPRDESRLIRADIAGLTVVNTYVPQGQAVDSEKFRYKLSWFERLADYFDRNFQPEDPVVWVGDLNIAPDERDVHDPQRLLGHVCFHPDVHQRLRRVMDWGFVDVFRRHCDAGANYTFWDYRVRGALQRNLGWRLDHVMATAALADASLSCTIDREPRALDRPSDHAPVTAQFEV